MLDHEEQKQHYINHERSGDLVVMSDARSWFCYYFWMDDSNAPDYARVVDIHRKPGYDPVEMFMTSEATGGLQATPEESRLEVCDGCHTTGCHVDQRFAWKNQHAVTVSSGVNYRSTDWQE